MLLTKMVDVDDARVEALTPEAFALVLEARGWWRVSRLSKWEHREYPKRGVPSSTPARSTLRALARSHHAGSAYDAFVEVERVQALLEAVKAAERGEWKRGAVWVERGNADAQITATGWVTLRLLRAADEVSRLWPTTRALPDPDPARAAREARAQLPRLVRIICGVEP